MAYGITSESQLIDIKTIQAGCEQYKAALSSFAKSGDSVTEAGETCSTKALSVDDKSLQPTIAQMGTDLTSYKAIFEGYADQVLAEAIQVYNAQVAELNAYRESLKQNN